MFDNTMEKRPRTLQTTETNCLISIHGALVFFLLYLNWGFSSGQSGIPEGASSLVFVFDTTGSMYDDLIQVRAGASKILSTTLERKVKPLYNYVLIPFHDPDVGPAIVTTSPDKFQDHLDNLFVQGGGDCPEMSLNAITLALEISLPGSFIYVFTDATAKDFDQSQKVIKLIQQKKSQVLFVLTGDCGNQTISEGISVYELIAAASTGQVFQLKKKDVNQMLKFVEESVQANRVNLISTDNGAAANKTYIVPVDNTLEELTIALSGKDSVLEIYHPNGSHYRDGKGLQKVLSLNGAKIIIVKSPTPGLWKVMASSNGSHTLRITGLSSMYFTSGFGLQPIKTQDEALLRPLAGFKNFALIKVNGLQTPGTAQRVQILDLQGHLLSEVPFKPREMDNFTFDWYNFEPPNGLFYIRVVGVDDKHNMFYRASPTALSAILPEPPKVMAPASKEVLSGSRATLWCTVKTKAPAKIQWTMNSKTLGPVLTHTGTINITHVITSVTNKNQGPYFCSATNVGGTGTASTQLRAKVPRTIDIDEPYSNLTLVTGDAVILNCVPDIDALFSIEWRKDGTYLTPQANDTLLLLIHSRNDGGRYECVATSKRREEVLVIDVVVFENPTAAIIPPLMTFQSRDKVTITCQVSGFPVPSVLWYKDDILMEFDKRISVVESSLVIRDAQMSDAGEYECNAWNIVGQSKATVKLLYTVPPSVFVDREEVIAVVGETVIVKCSADGTPEANLSWFKRRKKILPSRRIALSSHGHLVINAVQLNDAGYYTCLANNSAGQDSLTIIIQVHTIPRVKVDKEEVPLEVGKTVELHCAAVGVPTPTISWLKNNIPLQNSNRITVTSDGALIIKSAFPQDVGEYLCVGRNPAGKATAAVLLWSEGVPPRITNPPSDKTVTFGGNVTFKCRAEGLPKPQITWKNSLGISADTDPRATVMSSGDLFIKNIQLKDAGRYVCAAENNLGRDTAQVTLILTGLTPPIISKPDKSTIISDRGGTVELQCPAIGNPQPTISWRKNHQPVHLDGIKYKQKNSGALVISSLLPFDSGTYLCTAENPTGKDFLILTLHVYISPEIIRPPPNLAVDEGDSILMECVARGFPIPRIRWFQNNQPTRYNGSVVQIAAVKSQHTGVYRCVAENVAGNASATAVLAVRAPPVIFEPRLPRVMVLAGDWTDLKCNVSGYPKPTITWLRADTPIDTSNPKYVVLPSGSLRIYGLTLADSGIYSCEASNPLGQARHPVELSVQVPPEFIKRPENISIDEGDTIILECEVRGFPVPQITWYLNDSALSTNNSLVEIVDAIKADHEGVYRCEAKNPAGAVSASAVVTVNGSGENFAQTGKPEFVLTPSDAEVDAGSTFVWNCTATGQPIPVITWQVDGAELLPGYLEHVSILANNSLLIRGVKPEDAGHYQCRASNGVGVHVVQAKLRVRVNGNWSEWQEWEPCSRSCGVGEQYRFRTCDNPVPSGGGKKCEGSEAEMQPCNVHYCQVDGGWSIWADWTLCSEVCSGGEQTRYRECNNPVPLHGGKNCTGPARESRPCNTFKCSDGVEVAIGQVHGTVNNVMLPTLFLLANFTKTPTNDTHVSWTVSGLPGPIKNWLKSVSIPLTTPVYWATAREKPGAQNGLNITKGRFVFKTVVNFESGETLLIVHRGQGLNDRGVLMLDVVVKGTTPKLPPNVNVNISDFEEMFIKTGENEISSLSRRVMFVDGKPIPFSVNTTISYSSDDKQNGSLYNKVRVSTVDISRSRQTDVLEIGSTALVEKVSSSDPCPPGLILHASAQYCQDVNECTADPSVCSHFCINLFASFRCSCPLGHVFSSNNRTCEDVDECALGTGSCPFGEDCVNTAGSFRCRVRCPNGFNMTDNDTCVDVNECEAALSEVSSQPNNPCSHKCENLPGSFRCSCKDGYQLKGNQCEDIDECVTEICDQGCENQQGSYRCFCNQGYRYKSDSQCLDVDECVENRTICGDRQCANIPGSFQCLGKCDVGFKRTMDDKACVDVNECNDGKHNCKSNQMCMNTYGSFYCVCPRGYSAKTAQSPCEDVNECEQFQGICEYQCVNTVGSFECRCPGGGILNADQRTCSGVDGCAIENLKCEQRCDFSAQGYSCSCSRGYRLADNKQDCIDADECSSNETNSCQFACINTIGSYKCACPTGYHLSADGKKCQDVNECALTNGPCQQNQCYNTRGNYQCLPSSCPQQYHQVGGGFCVNQCSVPGYCAPQAFRQDVLPLPLEFPANTNIARLIPFFPPYMASLQYYCQFQYTFEVQPSPFGIRLLANEAMIYTKQKLEKAGIHKLRVTADLFYVDGTLACRTVFTVYIDVAKFSF